MKKILPWVALLASISFGMSKGAAQYDGMNKGAWQGDSAEPSAACDSNLTAIVDSIYAWADAIAAACSLVCDSGTVYFQWAADSDTVIIGEDTTAGQAAPVYISDTTGVLSPSTDYVVRFVFSADTGTATDTTDWRVFTTQDSTDTSDWWYFEPEETVIDSIAPVKGKRSSLDTVYVTYLPDSSATTELRYNAVELNKPQQWSDGMVIDTIPSWMPRGYYTPRLFDGTDTLAVSPTRFRVLVPEIITGGY
ncbi:MAG: hypothetical protein KKD77_24170 [Gammaproteobacteria bacterium]|nr:hypothetical protein [Gammaproteobacteria bacterium]